MTSDADEMESALDRRIDTTLRTAATSTAEARARVMAAVRRSARPVPGGGDRGDLIAGGAPLGAVHSLWRSPAFRLLAAAAIAGTIALVRAVGVDGPIPDVPGHPSGTARRPVGAQPEGAPVAAAAAGGGASAAVSGGERTPLARVQFVLVAPQAHRVAVVGDFNDWDPTAAPLAATAGVWSGEVDVPFGRHDYAFLLDGAQWVRDPGAPRAPADEFGNGYSVIVVGEQR